MSLFDEYIKNAEAVSDTQLEYHCGHETMYIAAYDQDGNQIPGTQVEPLDNWNDQTVFFGRKELEKVLNGIAGDRFHTLKAYYGEDTYVLMPFLQSPSYIGFEMTLDNDWQ